MVKDAPHITLTMGRDADGEKTTGDIGTLGLGFGIFQAWLYMAVFCVIRIFEPSDFTGFNFYLPESASVSILYTFLASSAITLIFIGASNQHYLRFYVSKLAMWLGAGLCSAGTLIAFLACLPFSPEAAGAVGSVLADTSGLDPLSIVGGAPPIDPVAAGSVANGISADIAGSPTLIGEQSTPLSLVASLISGGCMGVGSSLLVALWGTGFARVKFTTIVLNAAFSIPLGVIVAFLLTIWTPAPISGIITACLPFLAILFLMTLTPMPFYQRREKPVFDPFPAHKTSYIVRIGIPTVIMGVVLGALRVICVGEVLPSKSITIQLVLGAACAMSVVVFVAAIAMSRRNPYWDTLFRNIVPIIVIGSVAMSFIVGEYAVPAAFLVSLGYICLEVLMWVFFADLSNRFSLSPLFVFGLGRGILEIAGILGSALALWAFYDSYMAIGGLTLLALICAALMSVGYSVLPRYREFKGIVNENGDPEASTAHAVVGPRTVEGNAIAGGVGGAGASVVGTDAVVGVGDMGVGSAITGGAGVKDGDNSPRESIENTNAKNLDLAGDSTRFSTSRNEVDSAGSNVLAVSAISDADLASASPVALDASVPEEPLLAVDGVAEEANRAVESALHSTAQQATTPPGTDAVASGVLPDDAMDSDGAHEKGSFYRRCDEISKQYMLSKRECEVLPLLAKGHNAAFIQEKLCVSKSTAKTHINHIYKKLNIHTQQELLNMVEDRRRGPTSSAKTGSIEDALNSFSASAGASSHAGTHSAASSSVKKAGGEEMLGNNYMLDKNAFEKAVNEAAARPTQSRPKAKRGYRTSIFGD